MAASTHLPRDLGAGIYLVDAQFVHPEYAASYLVRGGDAWAFVETGTALSTPFLLAALAALRVSRESVSHVLLTHIHLDHAGGAGTLVAALPNAKLVVHPRGALHMADPTQLIAGATQVYGAAVVAAQYGTILPIPADRIISAADGTTVEVGGRRLRCLDAPGHAKHHVVIVDDQSHGVFTGDTFGLAYPSVMAGERPFLFPTTTPIQFDPEALHRSIDRIMSGRPERIFLTHFGLFNRDLAGCAAILHRLVDAHAQAARAVGPAESAIKTALVDLFRRELEHQRVTTDHEAALALWEPDLQLNAQGLAVWLSHAKP